jgi:hypothetical protein
MPAYQVPNGYGRPRNTVPVRSRRSWTEMSLSVRSGNERVDLEMTPDDDRASIGEAVDSVGTDLRVNEEAADDEVEGNEDQGNAP